MNQEAESPEPGSDAEETDKYRQVTDEFVQFWGEMGSNWGINRTMAQIHALLYCHDEPLNMDTIMERLGISRGNASMNLRSLTRWQLVEKVPQPGSRKDFYRAKTDVWHITSQIIKERREREIQPVKENLRAYRDGLLGGGRQSEKPELTESEELLYNRLNRLIDLMEVFEGFAEALLPLIEKRNERLIRQFIQVAKALQSDRKANDSA